MIKKKFNFRLEDLPVLTAFVLTSFEKDKADFKGFSPVFNEEFITNLQVKQKLCQDLVMPAEVLKQLKAITTSLQEKCNGLRQDLNLAEGYIRLAGAGYDVQAGDAGIKEIRSAISRGNVEGILSKAKTLQNGLKRNETILKAKGMKKELTEKIADEIAGISELNSQQNELKNKRSRVADENAVLFGELWDMLSSILDVGKALYRGNNDIKLREYTVAQLKKRVYAPEGAAEVASAVVSK
jgi:hypothetical protein